MSMKSRARPAVSRRREEEEEGDPFEMIAFAASAHPILERILQHFLLAAGVAYADDIYLTAKLSVLLPLLATLNKVVPEDTGMSFNIPKTKILVKDMSLPTHVVSPKT